MTPKQKALRKAELRRKRKARLAAEPAIQVSQLRRIKEPSTPSRYQEHGKYKRKSNKTTSITPKMAAYFGIH